MAFKNPEWKFRKRFISFVCLNLHESALNYGDHLMRTPFECSTKITVCRGFNNGSYVRETIFRISEHLITDRASFNTYTILITAEFYVPPNVLTFCNLKALVSNLR